MLFTESPNSRGRWSRLTNAAGAEAPTLANDAASLVCITDRGERHVALLLLGDVPAFVNGEPLAGRFRVLQHKDEILLAGVRYYFSAQSQPVVTVFTPSAGQRNPRCPICRMAIEPGDQVLQCPGCGRLFHEIAAEGDRPEKKCATYDKHCKFCGNPTALDGENFWTPDEEDRDDT